MNTNVRCAGTWVVGPAVRPGVHRGIGHIQPCGWEGDRPGRPTKIGGEVRWDILTVPDGPCPRCGGRVELIPQEP